MEPLALATFLLAAATIWLAWQTRHSETERQRETQILDAHPLVAEIRYFALGPDPGSGIEAPELAIDLSNRSPRPAVDVNGTIRNLDTGGGMSPAGFGIIDVDSSRLMTFELAGVKDTPVAEIIVESRGLMGQQVVQMYRWSVVEARAGNPESLVLTGLEIIPGVSGSHHSPFALNGLSLTVDCPPARR